MAKIYLCCASTTDHHPYARRDYERAVRYASLDSIGDHVVCGDPEQADLIAFIGSAEVNLQDVKNSELYKKYKSRAVLFNSRDKVIPLIPGVYASMERKPYRKDSDSVFSGFYLRVTENTTMDISEPIEEADYLFSFVGNASNHPVREKICSLPSDRAYLRDSSQDSVQQADGASGQNQGRGLDYRNVMANSKFVLCPRGLGASSWRLFETMRAGRVPVVISDDWLLPRNVDWDSFLIRVKESEVSSIPSLLHDMEAEAQSRGDRARKEWQRYYSEERVFNTLAGDLLHAHSHGFQNSWLPSLLSYTQYLQPFFFRHWLIAPLLRKLIK